MAKVKVDISMSLDGFIAGPNADIERPLGEGGDSLHQWAYGLASFRKYHGQSGGETGRDDEVLEDAFKTVGAVVMGRRMFSGGEGSWAGDPNADGWWGDTPPFGVPVFVLTHHPRETVAKQGGTTFTFVTDGIESALERARGARRRQRRLSGRRREHRPAVPNGWAARRNAGSRGARAARWGHPLVRELGGERIELERTRVIDSPEVTHLRFRLT